MVAQLPLYMKVSTKVAKPVHHSKRESIVINIKHILLDEKGKDLKKYINYRTEQYIIVYASQLHRIIQQTKREKKQRGECIDFRCSFSTLIPK